MSETLRITVPFDPQRTSANAHRGTTFGAMREWAELQATAKAIARLAWVQAGRPAARGPVRLSMHVRRARKVDLANLWGGAKPLIDGVFKDGVTPDDGPRWIAELGSATQESGAKWKGREEVIFIVDELSPTPVGAGGEGVERGS